MKKMFFIAMLAITICSWSIVLYANGKNKEANNRNTNYSHEDKLDPYWNKKVKLKEILDRIVSSKWDYNISVKEIKSGGRNVPGSVVYIEPTTFYQYEVDLPSSFDALKEIYFSKTVFGESSWFGDYEFSKYIQNPKYSFPVAVFLLTTQKRKLGPPPNEITPIIEKNLNEWNKDQKWKDNIINEYRCTKTFTYDPYQREIFTISLPKKFSENLFVWENGGNKKDGCYILGFTLGVSSLEEEKQEEIKNLQRVKEGIIGNMEDYDPKDEEKKKELNEKLKSVRIEMNEKGDIIPPTWTSTYGIYVQLIKEHQETGKADFSKVKFAPRNIAKWLDFVFAVPDNEIPGNLKVIIAYFKSQPEFKPLYPAIMMSLFISKGYSFDEAAGNYVPNELGKIMLDYIVENPIPENAERLKIIRDGGNEQLIAELMKKYNTTEKWNELMRK